MPKREVATQLKSLQKVTQCLTFEPQANTNSKENLSDKYIHILQNIERRNDLLKKLLLSFSTQQFLLGTFLFFSPKLETKFEFLVNEQIGAGNAKLRLNICLN